MKPSGRRQHLSAASVGDEGRQSQLQQLGTKPVLAKEEEAGGWLVREAGPCDLRAASTLDKTLLPQTLLLPYCGYLIMAFCMSATAQGLEPRPRVPAELPMWMMGGGL